MRALSIQQPWAWAILHAGKDIENRTWCTQITGRILIHVGKKFDKDGYLWIKRNYEIDIPTNLPLGGIVGSVEIVNCVSYSSSKWFFGKYGFVLRNPIQLPFMSCCGQLRFFDVNYQNIKAEVAEQLCTTLPM